MPIPKSDYEVVLDVPQWLLKKMAKVEPSPVVGRDGEGVYYIGKFSDVWAPEDLRNREFYYIHAKAILSPRSTPEFDDPLFAPFATALCLIFFSNHCGPRSTGSTSWLNCLDPQFESGGSCYGSAVVSGTSFRDCIYTTSHAPAMFIFNSSSAFDINTLVAYSKPCPTASTAPSISGRNEMSGRTMIRAVGCDDSSNRVRYVRYTAEDRSTATYTIASAGIGAIENATTIYRHAVYPLPSSVTKSANDYYYYIYTIGFQYQYT